jgi:hypothetical protein
MAAEEMDAARQGLGCPPRRGLGVKLAVGQRDGYAVEGVVVVVGLEVGRVAWSRSRGHVELPAARSPPGRRDPRRAGRKKPQDWTSVRPSRRAGRAAGRPSAAAAGLEVRRPSESTGRPGRGP